MIIITNVIYKKIYKKIKQYDKIITVRHIGPDPDAVASQIALRDSIRLTFPDKKVYAIGNSVSKFRKYGELDKVNPSELDDCLVIALDVPNLYRVDGISDIKYKEMIKIDHHPYEDKFGDVEYVDVNASSVCELLTNVIMNTGLKMDNNIASNLFLGIVSDSDRFLVGSTRKETFKVVYELIEKQNLDFLSLYPMLYTRPLDEIRFHGYLASNLKVTENGLGYIKITPEILKEYNVDSATPSNMINDFNNIKEVYAWMFVTWDEKNNQFKVNIRSRGPIINEIASKYNGGGHKFASGVKTQSETDIESLIKDLDQVCKDYKENL